MNALLLAALTRPLAAAEPTPPVLLDAGPLAGELHAGFTRLHLEGADDPRVRWIAPPQRALDGSWPDPLSGDALSGGRLLVDLPPGRWHVAALLGSESPGAVEAVATWGLELTPGPSVRVTPPSTWPEFVDSPAWSPSPRAPAGETAWDRTLAPRSRWLTAEVQVVDGLEIAALGRPLAALVLSPHDPSPLLARVDVERRATFLARTEPVDGPLPWSGADLVVAATGWDEAPDPARASATPELQRVAAPGERQGGVLWLPGDAAVDVEVRAPAGLHVEVWEVVWADTTAAVRPRRLRPTWLAPLEGTARGGQGLPVGVAVVLSADTPGRFQGSVRLSRGDSRLDVPLRLEVPDVELPPLPFPAGFIAQVPPVATALDGFAAPTVLRAIEQDMDRMRLLGADLVSLRFLTQGSGWPEAPAADATRLAEQAWAAWAARGGRAAVWPDPKVHVRPAAYVRGDDDPLPDDLAPALGELLQAVQRAPIPVIVPFWEEEGGWKNADAPDRARALVPQLRAIAPGVTFGATAAHPLDWSAAGVFDVVMLSTLPVLRRATVARVRDAGSTPWAYNLPPGRSGPLLAWAVGAEGLLQWHWSPAVVDPFHDQHPWTVFSYAAHGPGDTLWHSALAERFAQGLMDLRWLGLLQQELDRTSRSRSPSTLRERADAIALVDALRGALDAALPTSSWDAEALDPSALDALGVAIRTRTLALAALPAR